MSIEVELHVDTHNKTLLEEKSKGQMPQTEEKISSKRIKSFFIEAFRRFDDTRREYEKSIDKKESFLCAMRNKLKKGGHSVWRLRPAIDIKLTITD